MFCVEVDLFVSGGGIRKDFILMYYGIALLSLLLYISVSIMIIILFNRNIIYKLHIQVEYGTYILCLYTSGISYFIVFIESIEILRLWICNSVIK